MDQLAELEISADLLERARRYAVRANRQVEDLIDQILEEAISPEESWPAKLRLSCERCGVRDHRWFRTALASGGWCSVIYGCTVCYKTRRGGIAKIKGWESLQKVLGLRPQTPYEGAQEQHTAPSASPAS